MSQYSILFLLFRSVEPDADALKPQYQIFCQHEEGTGLREYEPGKMNTLKVLPRTKLSFKLVIYSSDTPLTIEKSVYVKDLALQPLESKTLSIAFGADLKKYYLIFDALNYSIQPEGDSQQSPIGLFDFKLTQLSGLADLEQKVEAPFRKKAIGFMMVEYELIFQYLNQIFNVKFTSTGAQDYFKKNTFVTNNNSQIVKVKLVASQYEWFVEGQSKHLSETKPIAETQIDISEFAKSDKPIATKKIYGDFGIDYLVEFRSSSFLSNFIGTLDFRVLSTSFNSEINNPSIILRQLGSDNNWTLHPYSKNTSGDYFWDYGQEKQKSLIGTKDLESQKLIDFKSSMTKQSDIETLSIPSTKDMSDQVDILCEMEKAESEAKEEEFNFVQRKNKTFFQLTVPNETICLELYDGEYLIGYCYFPMANMNFNQNYYEEINSLLPEGGSLNLGNIMVRLNFYPISIKSDLKVIGNLGSLDFDDISKKFRSPSQLFEASILMDKNIHESQALIWPQKITNVFTSEKRCRRMLIDIMEILNIGDIFSKDLDFNSLMIKVRLNNNQQSVQLQYKPTNLEELKKTFPKYYFLFTQEHYKQIKHEEETYFRHFIKFDKVNYGILSVKKQQGNHHFEFPTHHRKESLIVSVYHKNKIVDYRNYTLDGLPINEDIDTFTVPITFGLPRVGAKGTIKKTMYIKFQSMMLDEEDQADSSQGVFIINRLKMNKIYDFGTENPNPVEFEYDICIEKSGHRVLRPLHLTKETGFERTYFEHFTEVKAQENTEIKLSVVKLWTPPGLFYDEEAARKANILYEATIKLITGEDKNDPTTIAVKPGTCVDRRFELRDNVGKTKPFYFSLDLVFFYKTNKFLESPEGTIKVRIDNNDANFLKQFSAFNEIISLKLYIADSKLAENPYIYLDRSLDDPSNQAELQTTNWNNKLVLEPYGVNDVLLGRVLVPLLDIPLANSKEILFPIVINEIKIMFYFYYSSLLDEDDDEGSQVTANSKKGGKQDPKGAKGLSTKEKLAQQIRVLETENMHLNTRISMIKKNTVKKNKLIEYLKKMNYNLEAAKKEQADQPVHKKQYTPLKSTTIGLAMVKGQTDEVKSRNEQLKQLYNSICQCGKSNPKFKGFCEECLGKMKKAYEDALKVYLPIAQDYETKMRTKVGFSTKFTFSILYQINRKAAIAKKITLYEEKMKHYNFDFVNEEEEMIKDELKELKAQIIDRKNEIDILRSEHAFTVEKLKAQQKVLELELEKKTKKLEDILEQLNPSS